MGLKEIFKRGTHKPEPAEEAPVATQYIIRDSGGNTLDMGQFIGRAAQALEASTGDEALRTLREMMRNPVAAASVIGGEVDDIAKAGSVLLYQATGGQIVTKTLVEMVRSQQERQTEAVVAQQKAARYRGVRGRLIGKTRDRIKSF